MKIKTKPGLIIVVKGAENEKHCGKWRHGVSGWHRKGSALPPRGLRLMLDGVAWAAWGDYWELGE